MRSVAVTLCLIARDEAHNLRACLASAQGLADEVIVVDTGSTDGTPELAYKLGAEVIHQPWTHDFAAARNAGIRRAHGDWILVLDADERLAPGAAAELRGFVESEASAQVVACALSIVSLRDPDQPGECEVSHNIRLFRNLPGHRYSGAVHEQVLESVLTTSPNMDVAQLTARILHYGYLAGTAEILKKSLRNLALIQSQLAQSPNDPHMRYHAGVCLLNQGRLDAAIEELRWVVEQGDRTMNYAARAAKLWVTALMGLGRHEEARAILDRWQAIWPRYTDLEFMRSLICRRLGDLSEAVRSAERCLQMGPSPPPYDSDPGTAGYKAARVAGDMHRLLGDNLSAERAYRRVAPHEPGYTVARARLLMLYGERLGPAAALRRLFGEIPDRQRSLLMAEVCILAGLPSKGLEYARLAAGPDLGRRDMVIARCFLAAGDPAAAFRTLTRIDRESALWPEALRLRCLCAVAEGSRSAMEQELPSLLAMVPEAGGLGYAAGYLLGAPVPEPPDEASAAEREGLRAVPNVVSQLGPTVAADVLQRAVALASGQGKVGIEIAAALLGPCRRPDLAWQAFVSSGGGAADLHLKQRILIALGCLDRAAAVGDELVATGNALPEVYAETSRLYSRLASEIAAGAGETS